MLVTITNTSGAAINGLDTFTSGGVGPAAIVATGGQRRKPLPFPFGHVGELAAAAAVQLPMHPRDFRFKSVMNADGFDAGEEWQQLIQNGTVTFAQAAETGRRDAEELFMNAV